MSDNTVKLWTHYPGIFPDTYYDYLYKEISDKVAIYNNTIFGKTYPSPRMSCFFYDKESEDSKTDRKVRYKSAYFSYEKLPSYDWSESTSVVEILTEVQEIL